MGALVRVYILLRAGRIANLTAFWFFRLAEARYENQDNIRYDFFISKRLNLKVGLTCSGQDATLEDPQLGEMRETNLSSRRTRG